MVKQEPSYWLMKSEPDAYSIENLENDGVTLCKPIMLHKKLNRE